MALSRPSFRVSRASLVCLLLGTLLSGTSGIAEPATSISGSASPTAQHAIVTVVQHEVSIGALTLRHSVKEHASDVDTLVLVTPEVSDYTRGLLSEAGWRVIEAQGPEDLLDSGAFVRLLAFSLTQYKRVLLLEHDTLVLSDINDMFSCEPTCGVMPRAEAEGMSSSVLVLTPSSVSFKLLEDRLRASPQYREDLAGLLESHFGGFSACAFYEPKEEFRNGVQVDDSSSQLANHECKRLPTRYNGDLFLASLNRGLEMVRAQNTMPNEFRRKRTAVILRFDIFGWKPWQWQYAPFFPYSHLWYQQRSQVYVPVGRSITGALVLDVAVLVLALLAPLLLLFPNVYQILGAPRKPSTLSTFWYRFIFSRVLPPASYNPGMLPAMLANAFYGYVCMYAGFLIAAWRVRNVPMGIPPWIAWTRALVIFFAIFFFLLSVNLHLHYLCGKLHLYQREACRSNYPGGLIVVQDEYKQEFGLPWWSRARLVECICQVLRFKSMRETIVGFAFLVMMFVAAIIFKTVTGFVSVLVVLIIPGAILVIAAAGIGPVLFVQLPLAWYAEGMQKAKGAVQHHEAGVVTVEDDTAAGPVAELVLADDHRR